MRKNIEKEITYYNPSNEISIFDIIEQLKAELNEGLTDRIRYGNFIEIRFKSSEYDKLRITFKVNHGPIYYRFNKKIRLTSIEDKVQCYNESVDEWRSINDLDLSIFDNEVLGFYYKQTYKTPIHILDKKCKLVMHKINFFNEQVEIQEKGTYMEVEMEKPEQALIQNINNNLCDAGWNPLTLETCKVHKGSQALNTKHLSFDSIEDLKQMLYKTFLDMNMEYLE